MLAKICIFPVYQLFKEISKYLTQMGEKTISTELVQNITSAASSESKIIQIKKNVERYLISLRNIRWHNLSHHSALVFSFSRHALATSTHHTFSLRVCLLVCLLVCYSCVRASWSCAQTFNDLTEALLSLIRVCESFLLTSHLKRICSEKSRFFGGSRVASRVPAAAT